MPRRNFNDGQELSYVDFNAIGPAIQKELYDRICLELVGRVEDGFFDDSMKVEFATSTSVTVKAGAGFQLDNTQVSPEPMRRLLYNAAQATKNLAAADATHPRKDIICVKAALVTELTGSRRYKDPGTSAITTETMVLQKEWEADIIAVTGTPAASPSPPATPAGYLRIALCTVNAVTGMAGAADVTDERTLLRYGANARLDTSGAERITASSSVGLGYIIGEIDGLLDDALDDLTAKTAEIAGMKRRGVEFWGSTEAYTAGDIVQDVSGNGNIFMAIAPSTNVATTDPTKWKPLLQVPTAAATGGTTTATCDGMLASTFTCASTGNITITMDHLQDGQAYNVYLTGAAARTVAWTLLDPANGALTAKTGTTYSNTMTGTLSLFTLLRVGSSVIINSLHGIS